jgi:chorismate mutase / prephenate dehydratase
MAETPNTSGPAVPAELQALRVQIDSLDQSLLTLLNQRAALAQAVGEIKRKEGSVAFRPEREAQVIEGLKARNSRSR